MSAILPFRATLLFHLGIGAALLLALAAQKPETRKTVLVLTAVSAVAVSAMGSTPH